MSNKFANDIVLSSTTGSVTFRDPTTGTDQLKIIFHATDPQGSVDAPAGSIASGPAGFFVNSTGGTGGWATANAPIVPSQYFVDSSLSANDPARRAFMTIADAVAAAELASSTNAVIQLREGQTHTWDLTGLAGNDRSYTLFATGGGAVLALDPGTAPAAVGFGVFLAFENLTVYQGGNVDFGSDRNVNISGCSWDASNNVFEMANSTMTCRDTSFNATYVFSAGGGFGPSGVTLDWQDVTFIHTNASGTVLDGLDGVEISSSSIKIRGSDFTIFEKLGAKLGIQVRISNTSLRTEQTGLGIATIFGSLGGGGFQNWTSGVEISTLNTSTGTTSWGDSNFGATSWASTMGTALDDAPPFVMQAKKALTVFTPVVASGAGEFDLVDPQDIGSLLSNSSVNDENTNNIGGSIKIRWTTRCTVTSGGATALLRIRIGTDTGGTAIVQTAAVAATAGDLQSGEVDLEIVDWSSPNYTVTSQSKFTGIAAQSALGAALLGSNLKIGPQSGTFIRVTIEYSGADVNTFVLENLRIVGTGLSRG